MRNIACLFAAALLWAVPAGAGDRPVLVELFTSQGCSSCPPADAFLHELADREDVVALALHVDYWDYIGWKDSFADPEFTKRQRSYARVNGRKMVYTPQMIINGKEHVVGNRPRDVVDLIERHRAAPGEIALQVERVGDAIEIRAEAQATGRNDMVVQLIRYRPKSVVDIKRGENAGRTLSYANVVTELSVLGRWDRRKPLKMRADVTGDAPIVVLVQHKDHGPVAAVARLK